MLWMHVLVITGALLGVTACTPKAGESRVPFGPSPKPTASPTAALTPTPILTPTPTRPPTSTPPPIPLPQGRVAAGERALQYGDWDLATGLFNLAQSGATEPDVVVAAQLGLARAYLRGGKIEQAIDTLHQTIQTYPNNSRLAEATFLIADAYLLQGTWPLAIEHYEKYLEYPTGMIDSYVLERIGDARLENGDYAAAAHAYEDAILAERSGNLNFLILDKAKALRAAGDHPGALAAYDLVDHNTAHAITHAQMDYLRGQITLDLGDNQTAREYFQHAVANYPAAHDAYLALVALVEAKVEVDEFQRGLVDYHAGQYVPALQAFDRYLIANPEHDARVHYYSALSYRSLDDWPKAQVHFREIIATHPNDALWADAWIGMAYTQWAWGGDYGGAIQTYLDSVEVLSQHPAAPRALFDAARVAERQGDLSQAARLWSRVADDYSDAGEGPGAAFLAGISLYRQSLLPEALPRFEQVLDLPQASPQQQSAALLWIGKVQHEVGNEQGAIQAWEAAAATDPGGYYGLRSQELAAGRPPLHYSQSVNSAILEQIGRETSEAWMAERLGIENTGSLGNLSNVLRADGRWVRGAMLWRLGLQDEARTELDSLRRGMQTDALSSYQLSLAYRNLGYAYGAILAARNCVDALSLTDPLDAPAFVTYLRYGPYYQDLVVPTAQAYDLDPLLFYALIRQESLFQATVVSSAYAQGLMQIMPATGEWIANQLGWPDYDNSDLYRPFINVEFGAYYLDRQRSSFGGNLYAALAAYNAGPGNADIWHEMAGGDDDLFVEVIRLEQPQRYIRQVYEHYTVYQELYGWQTNGTR